MKFILGLLLCLVALTTTATTVVDHNYNPPGYAYCATNEDKCKEVATYDTFVVLKEPSSTCAAGYYYLIDNDYMTIDSLATETCSANVTWKFEEVKGAFGMFAVMYVDGAPSKMFPL